MTVDWAICQVYGHVLGATITYQPYNSCGAGCSCSATYYRNKKAWISGKSTPLPGDQIFFGNYGSESHTGIVEYVKEGKVYTIEGNVGKKVVRKTYNIGASNISGYGRPNYGHAECLAIIEKQEEQGTSQEENNNDAVQEEANYDSLLKLYQELKDLVDQYMVSSTKTSSDTESSQTKITPENILEKIRNSGDTEWFTNFQEKYNLLLMNFKVNLNKINQMCFSQLRDESEKILKDTQRLTTNDWVKIFNIQQQYYNEAINKKTTQKQNIVAIKNKKANDSQGNQSILDHYTELSDIAKKYEKEFKKICDWIVLSNEIPIPSSAKLIKEKPGIPFLWEKMFMRYGISSSAQKYYDTISEKEPDASTTTIWNAACYKAYKEAIDYYTNLLKVYTAKLNEAFQNWDYAVAWNTSFNILQINIYLLYFYVFGNIERKLKTDKETQEETDVEYKLSDYEYIKTGASYNYGFNNSDYWNFYIAALKNTKIFSDNLYLSTDIIEKYFILWATDIQKVKELYYKFLQNIEQHAENMSNKINEYYKALENFKNDNCRKKDEPIIVDWREIIYQMARDYFDYYQNPKYNYMALMQEANYEILKKDGTTGYEIFYTDILGFWRDLYYNPLLEKKEYDITTIGEKRELEDYNDKTCWWKIVSTRPSSLHFWFDLTAGYDELAKYTISQIGDRLKATKDTAIKALYYKDTPNIIYYEAEDIPLVENDNFNSYTYFQIGGPLLDACTISAQGKTAIDLLQDQLYKFAFCVENVSITTLPIYTLKPNYRILLSSQIPGLSGEYIVSKYSIPFTYNGTMQITATKAVPFIGING